MKYHIDTIPVWDAMKADSECSLCALQRKTERLLVERSLGASVMSPDTRIKVNDFGFCAAHHAMMYSFPGGNRLGHGLMMLSRLQSLRPNLNQAMADIRQLGKSGRQPFAQLLKNKKNGNGDAQNSLNELTKSCLVCNELEELSRRQAASLLHLWKTDPTFQKAFLHSKGLCVPHTVSTITMAPELLTGEKLVDFLSAAGSLLETSLKRLEEELDWFTRKFDYRNAQEPWGTSKDALERTVNKLRGWCLGSEPMQDEI
jgi:hypothetical protein